MAPQNGNQFIVIDDPEADKELTPEQWIKIQEWYDETLRNRGIEVPDRPVIIEEKKEK